jgi:hypothetical protein
MSPIFLFDSLQAVVNKLCRGQQVKNHQLEAVKLFLNFFESDIRSQTA